MKVQALYYPLKERNQVKTTLTVTPETKAAIDSLPPYLRLNEFFKFYGYVQPDVTSLGVQVKRKELMQYTTWQYSVEIGNLCRNFSALIKEMT